MEEVDKIIIHTLRDVGCDIEDEIRTIGQFDTKLIIEATVRCLEIINPEVSLLKSLPQNMAARFHVCASIAKACKDAGYLGEVGYQTFLYSGGSEIRRVLMFLIDRLPRETEKTVSDPQDGVSLLKDQLSRALRDQLAIRLRPGAVASVPFLPHQLPTSTPPPHLNPQQWREQCRAAHWATEQGRADQVFSSVVWLLEGCRGGSQVTRAPKPAPRSRPTPAPRPSWLSLRSTHQESTVEKGDEKEVDEETENKAEEEQTRKDIEQCETNIEQTRMSITVLTEKLDKVLGEIKELERGRGVGARLAQEAGGVAEAVAEMERELEMGTQRLTALAQHWEKRRRPLLDAVRQARHNQLTQQNAREERLDSIKTMKEHIEEIEKEISTKNLLKSKYEADLAKLPKDINRSMYTRRILEIIGNIRKQKDEIHKILKDTRQVQKEISLVTGRLERSFTVTDELIFKNAKKDESSRKAYKLLATLHSDCAEIVSLIQETGVIVREISDLQEQVETESAKKVGASLERITVDLEQMRAESELLRKQLASALPG